MGNPGLVHIISVVKSCATFKPWHNPKTHQPGLKMQTGKCPIVEKFPRGYHWSVMQVEYSLDLVFRRRERQAPLYEEISRRAVRGLPCGCPGCAG
ncbi:MAG: hypothetical protein H7X89_12270, partial [Rhizobiales bacterium]|nr:hypothetical protein [Hyphomicrobiales bacterium]